MSSFSGLRIALSSMQAQQIALEVTGHNIANVQTKGYSRQEAVFSANNPYQAVLYNGQAGNGVRITDVRRSVDPYMEQRIQNEQGRLNAWTARSEMLKKVEGSINSLDIPDRLNSFFNAWHNLSLDPNLDYVRFAVQQEGANLIDTLRTAGTQLVEIRDEIDYSIKDIVSRVNLLGKEIVNLNIEIIGSQKPNDLLDKRDGLLKELVGLTGAKVAYHSDSTVSVTLPVKMGFIEEAGEMKLIEKNIFTEIPLEAEVIATGGRLYGLKQVRDGEINSYLTKLSNIAESLTSQINQIHVQGINEGPDATKNTGINFFSETDFQDKVTWIDSWSLSDEVANDERYIAANNGKTGGIGMVALDVYNLGTRFTKFVSGFLSEIGTARKTAYFQETAHQDILVEMENARASVSGVSLDEEFAKMIQFQRAYEASAKVLTVVDEMLAALINTVR
ncbi:MAG: flagellar hook-associated protein FlgK [Bacillota bacterium]|jgi:flagellar hook-associated protein 1 FlgK